MERHTRTQAKRLFQCLQRNPLQLPYKNPNLLRKPLSFFTTSNLRNIQSWINRINLVLDIQSEKMKVGVSDIRDWLGKTKQESSRTHFLDDDFEYDRDDSRYYLISFPNEADQSHWHRNKLGKGEPPHIVYIMLLQLGKILKNEPLFSYFFIQNENVYCPMPRTLNFIQSCIKFFPMCFQGAPSVSKGTVNYSSLKILLIPSELIKQKITSKCSLILSYGVKSEINTVFNLTFYMII